MDAESDADDEGVDIDAGAALLLSPFDVDGADFDLVQVSKLPSARSNAVLKSGSCCFTRKLFMGGMVVD